MFDRYLMLLEQNRINQVDKDPRNDNEKKMKSLVEQTSFSLINCSLFWVFSVSGRKKLDEVDEDAGFSTMTSGVELNMGGSCWWLVRFNEGEWENKSKSFIMWFEKKNLFCFACK
jgi:hypothetical protein